MNDIIFVVLHFNTLSTTCDCVESIKENIDTPNYKIIVVDNCSPNNSFIDLKNTYEKDESVIVIKTDKNLGFAKGNNYGIKYAQDNYNFKYLCCCNNDILLLQKDFYKNLDSKKEFDDIAVIAPKVYRKDGTIQVYNNYRLKNVEYYKKNIEKLTFYKKHITLLKIKSICSKIIGKLKHKKTNEEFFMKSHYDIVLHGCFLIFTEKFFEYYDGFNPKTFLYKEEELLYVMVQKKKLKTYYDTNIFATHLEDVATNSINLTNRDKINFVYSNQIDSLKILIEEINND